MAAIGRRGCRYRRGAAAAGAVVDRAAADQHVKFGGVEIGGRN